MECPSCGAENADSATFCSLCLKPFAQAQPAAAPGEAGGARRPGIRQEIVGRWVSISDGQVWNFRADGTLGDDAERTVRWESPSPGRLTVLYSHARIESRYELIEGALRLWASLNSPDYIDLCRG